MLQLLAFLKKMGYAFYLVGGYPMIKGTNWSATKWLYVEIFAV